MIFAKPWHGKWCSRSEAEKMNNFLDTIPVPDRTQMKKEAQEFIDAIRKEKQEVMSRGEKWQILTELNKRY